jgi:hypothetical protein
MISYIKEHTKYFALPFERSEIAQVYANSSLAGKSGKPRVGSALRFRRKPKAESTETHLNTSLCPQSNLEIQSGNPYSNIVFSSRAKIERQRSKIEHLTKESNKEF